MEERLNLRWVIAGGYLTLAISLIEIGIKYFSGFSSFSDCVFWGLVGILIFPWSVLAAFLGIASLHAGSYELAQFSLVIGAILNAFVLFYWFSRGSGKT